jgi:hypothetical protein
MHITIRRSWDVARVVSSAATPTTGSKGGKMGGKINTLNEKKSSALNNLQFAGAINRRFNK